jgi:formate/nitrite transporter FocA (FNT family)
MKEKMKLLPGAIMAGFAIGIGGTLFLSVESKVVGALLFTVGLYIICVHGLFLYTGKVGYLPEQSPAYLVDLLFIWIGNFLGTGLAAVMVRTSRIAAIQEKAAEMCSVKVADNLGSLLILGIFCGVLMYAAVAGYKKTSNPILLYACVSAFILCGFEHCIADMFYFSVAGMWSGRAFLCMIVITLGNSIGGVLIPLIKRVKQP